MGVEGCFFPSSSLIHGLLFCVVLKVLRTELVIYDLHIPGFYTDGQWIQYQLQICWIIQEQKSLPRVIYFGICLLLCQDLERFGPRLDIFGIWFTCFLLFTDVTCHFFIHPMELITVGEIWIRQTVFCTQLGCNSLLGFLLCVLLQASVCQLEKKWTKLVRKSILAKAHVCFAPKGSWIEFFSCWQCTNSEGIYWWFSSALHVRFLWSMPSAPYELQTFTTVEELETKTSYKLFVSMSGGIHVGIVKNETQKEGVFWGDSNKGSCLLSSHQVWKT